MKRNTTQVPRETILMNQPHRLAYINPFEEDLLRSIGGAGTSGPGGIPQFGFADLVKDTWAEITSAGKADTATYNGSPSAVRTSVRPNARPSSVTSENRSSVIEAPKTPTSTTSPTIEDAMAAIRSRQDVLAERKGLSAIMGGIESRYLDKQYDMLENQEKYVPKPNFLQQALGYTVPGMAINALSSLRPDPVSYKPVYDTQGSYIGVAGYDAEGNPVSYSGDKTNYIETGSDRLDAMVRPAVEAPVSTNKDKEDKPLDSTGEDLLSPDPCPEGYVLDAETNTCVIDTATIGGGWTPREVVIPTELPTSSAEYTQPNIGVGGNPLMPYRMGGGLAAMTPPNQAGILQVAPAPMMPQQPALPNLTMPMLNTGVRR